MNHFVVCADCGLVPPSHTEACPLGRRARIFAELRVATTPREKQKSGFRGFWDDVITALEEWSPTLFLTAMALMVGFLIGRLP
jgi:hypothetical protein